MNWPAVVTSLMLIVACSDALSQKVYRCGPGGREYSQTPCPTGREIEVADPRSSEQQRDALAVAAGQARLAKDLRAERQEREREAATRPQGPAAIKPAVVAAATPSHPAEKRPKKKSTRNAGVKKDAAKAPGRVTSPPRP